MGDQQRPTGPALHWVLASLQRPAEIAKDATLVKVTTDFWPACHPYDDQTGPAANSSWLTPQVSYTPVSVTITLSQSASYDPKCGHGSFYDYWGLPVEIHLSEPLNGRLLLDGSTFPPGARPYH